jgi:hypothetical protein
MGPFKDFCLYLLLKALIIHALLSSSNKGGVVSAYSYPWTFTGRLWFRPALVRVPTNENNKPTPPDSVSILSFLGWTIGGVVALEYDDSPVGPYREYVTMGALVSKRGALGQWGSRLYVSNDKAEEICRQVWGVPAEVAAIDFLEGGGPSSSLCVETAPDESLTCTTTTEPVQVSSQGWTSFDSIQNALWGTKQSADLKKKITVDGWANTRTLDNPHETVRRGGIPLLWTPTIKSLWAPFVPFPSSEIGEDADGLPLHRLRISASALRLHFCGQTASELLGLPFGIGLSVDNILIEIGPQFDEL